MNDLLERYLGAVCAYFIGPKRKKVYNELKTQITSSVHQYDDMEDLLVSYGTPRSIALSYGYRSLFQRIYNPKIVFFVERMIFITSGIYLFLSTLYYLGQFNCLPFQSESHVVSSLYTSTFVTWLLSYPFIVMAAISLLSYFCMILLDIKNPVNQVRQCDWTLKQLYELPHSSHYPHHSIETIFMILFGIYFFIYTLFFSSDVIIQIQHTSYQMIHLMTYFFQPFIIIIFVDYIIDMTKRKYTRKYLKYSSLINLFTISALATFVINSDFLKDYLLPLGVSQMYTLVNIFIIGALFMISFISLYKLLRNLKYYRSLFRK